MSAVIQKSGQLPFMSISKFSGSVTINSATVPDTDIFGLNAIKLLAGHFYQIMVKYNISANTFTAASTVGMELISAAGANQAQLLANSSFQPGTTGVFVDSLSVGPFMRITPATLLSSGVSFTTGARPTTTTDTWLIGVNAAAAGAEALTITSISVYVLDFGVSVQ